MKTTIERGKRTKALLIKRMPPDVHKLVVEIAAKRHMTMTTWIIVTLEEQAKAQLAGSPA